MSTPKMQDLRDLHDSWAARYKEIEEVVSTLANRIEDLSSGGDSGPKIFLDSFWKCEKCGSKMAVYDASDETLRIKHKDLAVYFQPGVGGKITIICRTCGHQNHMEDSRSTDGEAEAQ